MKPSSPPQRALNDQEARAFKMLTIWEELVDSKRLCGTLELSAAALDVIDKYSIAKPLRISPSLSNPAKAAVRFDLVELAKYLSYVSKCVGFHVDVNGDVTTTDGITMNIPFANPPTWSPARNTGSGGGKNKR